MSNSIPLTEKESRAACAAPRPGEVERLVLERGAHVLASTPMSGDFTANALWGWELREKVAAPPDEFFIVDVRLRSDFEKGCIEGSCHMEFPDWARPANLAALPRDKNIVVVCETGDVSSQVTAGLRLLGYRAFSLRTGMFGWCSREDTRDLAETIKSAARGVERTPPERQWPEPPEAIPFEPPAPGEAGKLAARAAEAMGATPVEGDFAWNIISPRALSDRLGKSSGGEELFLLDLRREEDYEGVGHIPGAVQVNFETALDPEALALLPQGRKIVIICYTGNLAAQLAMILRMAGYDAAVLGYGMVCWTRTPTAFHYLKDIENAGGGLIAGR